MKLSPERLDQIVREMQLATQFNEKRWRERYNLSRRQVKTLRALAREQLAAAGRKGPVNFVVMALNSLGPPKKAKS